MDGPCNYFLAGAGFPGDEHRGVAVGHQTDDFLHLAHAGAGTDQRFRKAIRVGQDRRCRLDGTRSDHARQQRRQILPADWFAQVVESAEPHRFDGVRRCGVGGNDGNRDI
jgi:hypothetical protein